MTCAAAAATCDFEDSKTVLLSMTVSEQARKLLLLWLMPDCSSVCFCFECFALCFCLPWQIVYYAAARCDLPPSTPEPACFNHCALGFCQLTPCVVLPARQVDLDKLDYHHYLPIFFDGIRETQDPYRFLAIKGVEDLLAAGEPSSSPPQIITDIQPGGAALRHVHATPE